MVTNDNPENAEKCLKFSCEKCAFTCSKQSNYDIHLTTRKHKMIINGNEKHAEKCRTYICSCGKIYKHISGLSRHKKKCTYVEEIKNEVEPEVIELSNAAVEQNNETEVIQIDPNGDKDEIIMKLLKQNSEVIEVIKQQQKQMGDIIPKIGNNNITNNNTMNNNFNFQLTKIF